MVLGECVTHTLWLSSTYSYETFTRMPWLSLPLPLFIDLSSVRLRMITVSDWAYISIQQTVQCKPPAGDNSILYIVISILYELYVILA